MENVIIPNHYSALLSKLDLEMAVAIPPGGNWKNIPVTIPSRRVEQIRDSYMKGGGSRSTYYGRLLPDKPSYTINTNFNRPGNGCHLHYDFEGGQHRVISQREAARLQSFPDNFVFSGSIGSINTQIGNAVPPLLAYQIAKNFPSQGAFIDLFSGAGGLSLGFVWAGWEPIVANDINPSFLETYSRNIHSNVVVGDIRDQKVFNMIVDKALAFKQSQLNKPVIVIGGPPCQGFSTAGNRRSMEDDRNRLFFEYKKILEHIKPDAFVFENVTGLLNMEGGKVFDLIKSELMETVDQLNTWILHTAEYAIPQRRSRVFLIGSSGENKPILMPKQLTSLNSQRTLFDNFAPAVSVYEALSDLPPVAPGEDGSCKEYVSLPNHPYQMLMRCYVSPSEYLKLIEG